MTILRNSYRVLTCVIVNTFFFISAHAQVSSLPNGFPINDADEGKFLAASDGLSSLGAPPIDGKSINVHIRVPIATPTLEIEIFDPDLYSDRINQAYWDFPALNFTPAVTAYEDTIAFELYPDVNVSGNSTNGKISELIADPSMDSQWVDFFKGFPINIDRSDAAACEQGPRARYCYYHLVTRWVDAAPPYNPKNRPTTYAGNVLNGFIVSSNGMPFLSKGSSVGVIGMTENSPAFPVPPTNFDGTISFRALIEETNECSLDIYDGDADRAGSSIPAHVLDETDDPNTPPDAIVSGFFPFPVSVDTLEEGVMPGNPADNSPNRPELSIGVPIYYTVNAEPPAADYGVDCCVNDNPSGDREWELYRIASMAPGCPDVSQPDYDPDNETMNGGVNGPAPAAAPDEVVNIISPGYHNITLNGMDENNLNFLNVSADIFAGEAIDYGDAPYEYETTLANNAASHDIDVRLTLGTEIDTDMDGAPSTDADGDDNNLVDDEDGVTQFNPLMATMGGQNYSIDVRVRNELDSGDSANLIGWIDFDGDKAFEASESASAQVNPGDSTARLVFVVPHTMTTGQTYARLRLTTDPAITTLTPGGSATDGEVEDYRLNIETQQCRPDPETGEGCECIDDPEEEIACPIVVAQGCSVEFWADPTQVNVWPSYTHQDTFRDVFSTGSHMSLFYTLNKAGQGGIAFRRQATAALLNAADSSVEYFQSVNEVIDNVKRVYNQVWHTPSADRKNVWKAAAAVYASQNSLECSLNVED